MTLTRRRLLAATFAPATFAPATFAPAAFAPLPAAAAPPPAGFFLIGDWGRDGTHHQRAVAAAMATAATARDPRWIVSAGDNFYEDGVTGVTDPQWRRSFEAVYHQPSLQRPWPIVLGNHDYRGNVEAQIAYSARSARWQLPARHYLRHLPLGDGTAAAMFFLDTSPFIRKYLGTTTRIAGQDPAAQLAWLRQSLAASSARWKIVIGHHPVFTARGGPGHDQPDLIAALAPVLRAGGVRAYLNGHDHTMQFTARDGTAFVTCGAGSKISPIGPARRPGFVASAHGFLAARFQPGGLRLAFIDSTGRERFAHLLAGG